MSAEGRIILYCMAAVLGRFDIWSLSIPRVGDLAWLVGGLFFLRVVRCDWRTAFDLDIFVSSGR